MLSDEDLRELKRIIVQSVQSESVVFNGVVDANKLPRAIADAIITAIKYCDEHRS